jgi:hypothetical protein
MALPRFDLSDLGTSRDGLPHHVLTALAPRSAAALARAHRAYTGWCRLLDGVAPRGRAHDPARSQRFSSDRLPDAEPGSTLIADSGAAGAVLDMIDDPHHGESVRSWTAASRRARSARSRPTCGRRAAPHSTPGSDAVASWAHLEDPP